MPTNYYSPHAYRSNAVPTQAKAEQGIRYIVKQKMQRILVLLLSSMIIGCSDDIDIPQDVQELCQMKSLYPTNVFEIDEHKTASAPWPSGSIVTYSGYTPSGDANTFTGMTTGVFYRKFLGITTDGYYVVQEFFSKENKKKTDPYLLWSKHLVVTSDFYVVPPVASGYLMTWYANGNPSKQVNFVNRARIGLQASWRENGDVTYEQVDKGTVTYRVKCSASGKVIDFYNLPSQ